MKGNRMLNEKTFLIKNFKLQPQEPYEKLLRDDLLFSEICETVLIFGGAFAEEEEVNRTGAMKATLSRLYSQINEWFGDEMKADINAPDEAEPDETGFDSNPEEDTEVVPVEPVVVKAPRKVVRKRKTPVRK